MIAISRFLRDNYVNVGEVSGRHIFIICLCTLFSHSAFVFATLPLLKRLKVQLLHQTGGEIKYALACSYQRPRDKVQLFKCIPQKAWSTNRLIIKARKENLLHTVDITNMILNKSRAHYPRMKRGILSKTGMGYRWNMDVLVSAVGYPRGQE